MAAVYNTFMTSKRNRNRDIGTVGFNTGMWNSGLFFKTDDWFVTTSDRFLQWCDWAVDWNKPECVWSAAMCYVLFAYVTMQQNKLTKQNSVIIRYNTAYLTCSTQLMNSQLSLPHEMNKKKEKPKSKEQMISPVQFSPIIMKALTLTFFLEKMPFKTIVKTFIQTT